MPRDLSNPARAIFAPVPADVLQVLEGTQLPLTGATVARLAGRSHAQVYSVLRRLVEAGLVDATKAGQASLYTLNQDHVLAPSISLAFGAYRTLAERITTHVEGWPEPPVTVALFGSAARRDGSPESDLDVLLIRPDEIDAEDENWRGRRHDLASSLDRWTGNSAQIVELSRADLQQATRRRDSLPTSLLADARDIWGTPVRELMAQAQPH